MNEKEKHLLFWTILALIVLVNLTLSYGLFSHFVLGRRSPEVNWLLTVFAAEFVGCIAVAWRRVLNADAAPHNASCEPMVIEKPAMVVEDGDACETLLKMGRRFLDEARDSRRSLKTRRQLARRALELFAQILKGHPSYHSALYNSGTAYRILGEFDRARSAYLKSRKVLRDNASRYTTGERRILDADVEMMVGTVYEEEGLFVQARACYINSLTLDPHNIVRQLNLHKIAVRMGKREEAHVWAEMLSRHPSYSASIARVVEDQSMALAAAGDDDEEESEVPAGECR